MQFNKMKEIDLKIKAKEILEDIEQLNSMDIDSLPEKGVSEIIDETEEFLKEILNITTNDKKIDVKTENFEFNTNIQKEKIQDTQTEL